MHTRVSWETKGVNVSDNKGYSLLSACQICILQKYCNNHLTCCLTNIIFYICSRNPSMRTIILLQVIKLTRQFSYSVGHTAGCSQGKEWGPCLLTLIFYHNIVSYFKTENVYGGFTLMLTLERFFSWIIPDHCCSSSPHYVLDYLPSNSTYFGDRARKGRQNKYTSILKKKRFCLFIKLIIP